MTARRVLLGPKEPPAVLVARRPAELKGSLGRLDGIQPTAWPAHSAQAPGAVHDVLESAGEPLDRDVRTSMEPLFGHDFSRVRVHADAPAAESAQGIAAQAYVVGEHLVVAPGRYAPHTPAGRRLLAHELAHVVQQRPVDEGGGVPLRMAPVGSREEGEADVAAQAVLAVDRTHFALASRAALAAAHVARRPDPETWSSVHQRILKGMIDLVKRYPADGEERLEGLTQLFATVPDDQASRLYGRLEPGAKTDDFAQYFKNQFPSSRLQGLAFLRQKFGGTRPPEQPSSDPSRSLEKGSVGKAIAVASCQLPTEESGGPLLRFGRSMQGDGYLYNPKYWVVEYTLSKGDEKKTFSSSKAQPSAWRQAEQFLEGNAAWHGSLLDITIKVGSYGASAAINDVWNPGSSELYAIDCLGAATLVQLRGTYLSYPEADRDAAFDRDYSDFKMERFDQSRGELPRSSLGQDLDVVKLPSPVPIAADTLYEGTLQPGDEIPVENRFMPRTSAWWTENVIYVGDRKFFGHPIGVVTLQEYARKIARFIPREYVDPEIGRKAPTEPGDLEQFVLQHAYVASYSRPRTRSVAPVAKPGEQPGK